ncbi:hypothetical protein KMP13_01635 [Epibacterium ulvae]|uniref:hypothetical protein n=1 Tax=Epibacterium ulvae TaxID=1156985 RepID=UPI001BFC7F2E|nr:hypothetical protein [Epibacterium ulvae]MBT8152617.1 hypothetical protein [Epibacterium ulvae]
MTRVWQIGLVCVLACTLILQGQSAAARVTMTDAAGQIVICTGTGPMTVYVDADGQPVDAPVPCPDCLILSVVALLTSAQVVSPPSALSSGTTLPDQDLRVAGTQISPSARAPPKLV